MDEDLFFTNLKKCIKEEIALIAEIGDFYIQFSADGPTLLWEAINNYYITKKKRISESKITILENLGFVDQKEQNFAQLIPININDDNAIRDIAQKCIEIFINVYGVSPVKTIKYKFVD